MKLRKARSQQKRLGFGIGIAVCIFAGFATCQDVSPRAENSTSENDRRQYADEDLTKFDLEFPGGTVTELVTAIGEAADRKVNILVPIGLEDVPVQPFSVSKISFADLSELLAAASQDSADGRIEFQRRNGGWVFANRERLHSGQFGIEQKLESELSKVHEQLEDVERQLMNNAFARARKRAQSAGRREVELSAREGSHSLVSQHRDLRGKLYTLSRRASALERHLATVNEKPAIVVPRRPR